MRRKKLAARILSVFVAAACILANNSSLIAAAAENTGTEEAQDLLQSGNEGSDEADEVSEETDETENASNGDTAESGVTAENAQETDPSEVSGEIGTDGSGEEATEETEASDPGEEVIEETEAPDPGEEVIEGTEAPDPDEEVIEETAEETEAPEPGEEAAEENEAAGTEEEAAEENEAAGTEEEASEDAEISETQEPEVTVEEAQTAAEEVPEAENEQPEAMEIIDSDGVIEGSSQGKMDAASWQNSVEDILSADVIGADVDTASADCVLAGVTGTYITDTDAALARINEIRYEACEEGVLNPDTNKPLTTADYVPIKWSGDLEYIARMRAAESAYTGGHARMNGKDIWSLTSPSGVRSWGEVLAWNNGSSMIAGINQWYGEKADWVNQKEGAVTGHYTQMIDPTNLYVGLGTFCTENTRYYNTTAGEFSFKTGLDEYRMDMSGDCVQLLDISLSNVNSSGRILGKMMGAPGTEAEHLMAAPVSFKFGNSDVYFMNGVNWSSSDPAVATVSEDGTVCAVESGTAVIEASAAGGTVTASAEFTVKSINDCEIELGQTVYTYDGDAKKPAVTVSYKGTALKEGTDYTVSYGDNVNAGTAAVMVTGSEEYAGSVEKTFTIEKAEQTLDVQDMRIEYATAAQIEVNGAHTDVVFESLDTAVASVNEEGTVTGTGAGSARILVKTDGDGNYKPASASLTVTVTPVSLRDSDRIGVSLTATEFTYDGSEQKPGVRVTCDGRELTAGSDYTAAFGESTNAGEKSVVMTGSGNYTGTVTANYTILKAQQTLKAEDVRVEFGGSEGIHVTDAHGKVTYKSQNTAVAKVAADGTVTGAGAGETSITAAAAGDDNYEAASISIAVTVTQIDISDASRTAVSLSATEFTYDGSEKKPEISVSCDGRNLIAGTDYEAAFGDCVNAGEKTVQITGTGNYTGLVEKNYRIRRAPQRIIAQDLVVGLDKTGKIKVSGAHTALTFESEDTSVAAVAEDGTVSGVGEGGTVITVLAGEDDNYEAASTRLQVTVFKPADLTRAQIKLQTTAYTYDGKAKKPAVTVTADGNELSEGYTVTYVNNVNAGEADAVNGPKAVITGDGNTAVGRMEVPFTIKKAEQKVSISANTLTVDAGKTGKVTVTGPIGTVKAVFESTATAKATVSANTAAAGKTPVYTVTVSGITVGKTTMTVKASGDKNHEAAKVTCTIKVRPKATASFKAAPAADGKGIRLAWTKAAGATNYQIYRNGKLVKTVGNVASWTDTGANTNGAKYTFKIYAKADTGVSGQYKSVIYYKLSRPAAPRVTNSAAGKATVKWAKNDKSNGYQIQYGLKSNFSGAKSVTLTKNSILSKVIGSLSKGKIYYVRTRTYKKVSGETYYSAWSAASKIRISK